MFSASCARSLALFAGFLCSLRPKSASLIQPSQPLCIFGADRYRCRALCVLVVKRSAGWSYCNIVRNATSVCTICTQYMVLQSQALRSRRLFRSRSPLSTYASSEIIHFAVSAQPPLSTLSQLVHGSCETLCCACNAVKTPRLARPHVFFKNTTETQSRVTFHASSSIMLSGAEGET